MKRGIVFVFSIFIILGLSATRASAGVLYSNFGPSMAFDTNPANSYFVDQSGITAGSVPPFTIGAQFTSPVSATFEKAQLPLFLASENSGPNVFDVYLESDSSGQPGSVISEFELTNLLTSTPTIFQVGNGLAGVSLISGQANPALAAVTPYWLVVNAPDAGTVGAWSFVTGCVFDPMTKTYSGCSDTSTSPSTGFSNLVFNTTPNPVGGPWTSAPNLPRPAFEIDSQTVVPPPSGVPEPADGILLGTGLLAVYFLRRRLGSPRAV